MTGGADIRSAREIVVIGEDFGDAGAHRRPTGSQRCRLCRPARRFADFR